MREPHSNGQTIGSGQTGAHAELNGMITLAGEEDQNNIKYDSIYNLTGIASQQNGMQEFLSSPSLAPDFH